MSGYRSGVSLGRLVTKLDTAGQTALPSSTTTTTANTSTADLTFGAWSQVAASTSAQYLIVGIEAAAAIAGTGGPLIVDIGTGGSGSETTIATALIGTSQPVFGGTNVGPGGHANFTVPLRVSAGTRLAVRVALGGTGGSARAAAIQLLVVPYANTENS